MPATDEFWRSLPKTHKVFAVSAIMLLASTLLMMMKDESRSWRRYQTQAEDYRVQRLEKQLEEFDTIEHQAALEEAEQKLAAAQKEWDAQQTQIRDEEQQLQTIEGQLQILARDSKTQNAIRDKARADYDIAVRDHQPENKLAARRSEFEKQEEAARKKVLELEQFQTEFNTLNSKLQAHRSQLTEAEAELKKLVADRDVLIEQRDLIRPPTGSLAALKRKMKELPIINGFNPHLKIQYDWPKGLEQTLGMTSVTRVDRCRTCHVNISDFGAGNVANYPKGEYPEPFCSHPSPELYLSATSPHPVEKFGCTICHEGDGSGTSFFTAEHSAPDPAIGANWKDDHGWKKNHFWEYPMFPKPFIEASCLRCHHNVTELGVNEKFGATAPKVYEGFSLIRDYGCFGCHEINGFDGTTPIGPDMRLEPQTAEELAKIANDPLQVAGTMRKVGPSLKHVDQKLTPEFVASWTAEPKAFRPDTKMPQFFDLTNQHDAMAALLQPVELSAISAFLSAKSQPIDLLKPAEGYEPDVARGEELFSKKGCLACHSHQGEEFAGIESDFGPDLTRIHEKIKPGEEGFHWLYSWIKEPSRYHPRTRMPDLFLDPYEEEGETIDPAADIAHYLLQGGAGEFPELAQITPSLGIVLDADFTPENAAQLGVSQAAAQGVFVTETINGSPAARSQSRSGDNWIDNPINPTDVITAWNGQPVTSIEQFKQLESAAQNGEQITLTVQRNSQPVEFRVTVSTPLDDLVRLYLSKSMTKARVEGVFENKRFPVTTDMYAEGTNLSDFVKGDEIELAPESYDETLSDEEWNQRKLIYLGRRTIARYGCYGCHDIPEFEEARPIGTALQDWGRKDTSKLAYEHIHEFLNYHGEPDGSSTAVRLEHAVKRAAKDPEAHREIGEQTMTEALLYESVISHGRAGFLWQKLRDPRSYDYKKTETKGWDERLRMPQFPLEPKEIEAITTFVLGLVADPPAPDYQFRPTGRQAAIFEGERLLQKYNCAGCHLLEMPEWEFGVNLDDLILPPLTAIDEEVYEKFKHIKPSRPGMTGKTLPTGEPILKATGYAQAFPDPDEDPEYQLYSFVTWDPIDLEDGRRIMPGQPIPIMATMLHSIGYGRGGDLAHWLIPRLPGNERGVKDLNEAWQAAPPPLVDQGKKVQTPWLYQFLKEPEQLRFTTVLRMPKFNMDDQEAQALANYFAARDGVPYPYQDVPQKNRAFQAEMAAQYHQTYPDAEHDFLSASWLVLNGPLCRKCHAVGGNPMTETDPSQVKRGPNLGRIEHRLQPDYTELWVYNPKWILPYTSMPQNFPSGGDSAMTELFDANNLRQSSAIIDALFNYATLIEQYGTTTYDPPEATPEGGTE